MEEKPCSKCRKVKKLSEFSINKDGQLGKHSHCLQCRREYHAEWRRINPERVKVHKENWKKKLKEEYKRNPEKYHEQYKKYTSTISGHLATLIRNARFRAKKNNIPFQITKNILLVLWKKQQGKCAVSGVRMTTKKGTGRSSTTASIDRITPEKGYILENIRLVCYRVNEMKSDGTDKELNKWCKIILENSCLRASV